MSCCPPPYRYSQCIIYGALLPGFFHSLCLFLYSGVGLISAQTAVPTQGPVLGCDDLDNAIISKVTSDRSVSALGAEHATPLLEADQEEAEAAGMPRQNSELRCSQPKSSELPWSNVDLAEIKIPLANATEKSVAVYPMELGEVMKQEEQPPWAWITAGQCEIESNINSWLEMPGT